MFKRQSPVRPDFTKLFKYGRTASAHNFGVKVSNYQDNLNYSNFARVTSMRAEVAEKKKQYLEAAEEAKQRGDMEREHEFGKTLQYRKNI